MSTQPVTSTEPQADKQAEIPGILSGLDKLHERAVAIAGQARGIKVALIGETPTKLQEADIAPSEPGGAIPEIQAWVRTIDRRLSEIEESLSPLQDAVGAQR